MSLNKVMLIGNVGKDPDIRYLESNPQNPGANPKVATFPLATSERYRDRSGDVRENTEWHNIVAWRNNADVAEKYIRKGTQLFIEGRLRTRQWTDQTGNKRYTTEVVVDTLQLLGKRPDGQDAPQPQQGGYAPQPAQAAYAPQPAYSPQPAQAAYAPQPAAAPGPAPVAPQPAPAPVITPGDVPSDDLPF
ncbi:MAG: single-stranded DNA-binding protein [Bacteroidales bacterium]|nr:single-stranded DNA-binding protein [Bacteroidales bacterium]